jgi:hypothetical protein
MLQRSKGNISTGCRNNLTLNKRAKRLTKMGGGKWAQTTPPNRETGATEIEMRDVTLRWMPRAAIQWPRQKRDPPMVAAFLGPFLSNQGPSSDAAIPRHPMLM